MSDIITLSSSDEESSPPKKRLKLNPTILIDLKGITITPVLNKNSQKLPKVNGKSQQNIVVLSDDDDLNVKEALTATRKTISELKKNNSESCVVVDDAISIIKSNEAIIAAKKTVKEQEINSESCVVVDDAISIIKTKENYSKNNLSKKCIVIDDIEDCEVECNEKKNLEEPIVLDNESIDDVQNDCKIVEPNDESTIERIVEKTIVKEIISEDISSQDSSSSIKDMDTTDMKESNEHNTVRNGASSKIMDETLKTTKEPCTSTNEAEKFPQTILLESFLNSCEQSVKNTQYSGVITDKIPRLWKLYKKCERTLGNCSNFKELLQENTERAQQSAARSMISFKDVLQHIKDVVNTESLEVPEDLRLRLKKLEKTIKCLTKRIHHLENAEVDFDDEEDSTYIQVDRFKRRLTQVYKKYCQLLNRNPNVGRVTYAKLDFVASDYNEINRAISKKYKNNQKFPSYYEMETFVKKIVQNQNLPLSEARIKQESAHCFKKLGELLQSRRKRELYDAHYDFIRDNNDPAFEDSSLNDRLKENYTQGQMKIDKLCQEYAIKQELGVEADISEGGSDKTDSSTSDEGEKNQLENKVTDVVQEDN